LGGALRDHCARCRDNGTQGKPLFRGRTGGDVPPTRKVDSLVPQQVLHHARNADRVTGSLALFAAIGCEPNRTTVTAASLADSKRLPIAVACPASIPSRADRRKSRPRSAPASALSHGQERTLPNRPPRMNRPRISRSDQPA